MGEVVRFAPSPTGFLHIGNVRTALYNWLEATRTGGRFILRFDDTDVARSEARFADAIAEDLAWLGIHAHQVEHQSARLAAYDAAADRLKQAGLLYRAYETPEELDRKRALQRARGLPPVYDRAALSLTEDDHARLVAEGRAPHWRFKLPEGQRHWDDGCRGPQTVNLGSLSDPVLIRADGSYLYTLPSVVDDADLGVTLVIRGEDHITNTGVQIALFEALGASPPRFAHHNLLTRADGEPLSKRDNPLSVQRLREAGYEAMAVASLAVLVGTSHAVEPVASLAELAERAPLGSVSRGPATFDPDELGRLNGPLVHGLPAAAVTPLLEELGVDARFWEAVRANLQFRHEARDWAHRLNEDVVAATTPDDADFLRAARDALPEAPWDAHTFGAWTKALREATGRKGKALFMPLRRALTGIESGPEMGTWLVLLGPERTKARLTGALEAASVPATPAPAQADEP